MEGCDNGKTFKAVVTKLVVDNFSLWIVLVALDIFSWIRNIKFPIYSINCLIRKLSVFDSILLDEQSIRTFNQNEV